METGDESATAYRARFSLRMLRFVIHVHYALNVHLNYKDDLFFGTVQKRALDVRKMNNRRKQNFKGEANNTQLDKEDTRRSLMY